MHIGKVSIRGEEKDVYMPTKNKDELCLPHIGIGAMGSGKSSFGINWAIEACYKGYGVAIINPADAKLAQELALGVPKDKFIHIDFGKNTYALDWCEVKHSKHARDRLSRTIIDFFDSGSDDTGPQTARYLRAAIMAMQSHKLSEINKLFEDRIYREAIIQRMPQNQTRKTLESFSQESPARQSQIASPIYNRMDSLLGSQHMSKCVNSNNSIDFFQIMNTDKVILIDVPSMVEQDTIVKLLSTKIDLAMTLRDGDKASPFFVIFDEPHQYMGSAKTWWKSAVESRKWRVGYIWLFHSWNQVKKYNLDNIIKSAGPHYHIFPTTKEHYDDLKEELQPFTKEEAMETPTFHAINILKAGGATQKPFLAKMAPPPSIHNKYSPKEKNNHKKQLADSKKRTIISPPTIPQSI